MLSIVLQVFNALATEGLCIPPELKEEASKSGDLKFEDIEEGGLGEGEGQKDVSDKIETEDQLDDTVLPGQEKKDEEEKNDIRAEKNAIEMSDDFEGQTFDPEQDDESENESSEDESEEIEKQMGDVDGEETEKLDEKVWGSDSEDEDQETRDEDDTGGVTQDGKSEMVAKDGKERDDDTSRSDKGKDKEELQDAQADEYDGEHEDPYIDAPPLQEPEVVELPDDMEIGDDTDKNDDVGDTDILDLPEEENGEGDKDDEGEADENKSPSDEPQEIDEDMKDANAADSADEDESQNAQEKNESALPTHTPTTEAEALSAQDHSVNNSKDPVQENEKQSMNWESSVEQSEEPHREGLSESMVAQTQDLREGKRSNNSQNLPQPKKSKLDYNFERSRQNRTLEDDPKENARRRPLADKQSEQNTTGQRNPEDNAEVYEHTANKEEGVQEALDIATEEQKGGKKVASDDEVVISDSDDNDDDEIVIGSSDEEYDNDAGENRAPKLRGDTRSNDRKKKPGNRGDDETDDSPAASPEGDPVLTHTVLRAPESTIHTQTDLWATLSDSQIREHRTRMETSLQQLRDGEQPTDYSLDARSLWREYEFVTAHLAQELCEQLRLVLEPTKTAKLKGDYRTGKRLNMRKIIPYIASQFRKDKIWLRRTKPSKRQYQIMLAIDNSKSMEDNHLRQLAFESMATIGQSLKLLESGELSIIKFGKQIGRLLNFNDTFDTESGARVFSRFTFSEDKTNYLGMLEYAVSEMVSVARTGMVALKEISQLLIVLSDGRGINSGGGNEMQQAVKRARNNNIFMIFIILDNPSRKSIMDITKPIFVDGQVVTKSYLSEFPFPFYIILRDIASLPTILGEALRQWFELVTSSER